MSIDHTHFSPVTSLAGGALIGSAVSLLALGLGRIAGISGMLAAALRPNRSSRSWQLAFCAGLLASPWLWQAFRPLPAIQAQASWERWLLAGLLVGYGARLAGGCTSGHGVCGLSRGSPRSLLATASFMLTGFLVVWLDRHGLRVPRS